MDPSKEVSASEKERKPAGEESEEASSTSSGMYSLNLSSVLIPTRPRTIFSQCGYPPGPPPPSFLPHLGSLSGSSGQLRSQRTLAVPSLLLTTLEEMNPQELKTFQSFLTSGLLPDCPPIPESQLENADRQVTVDQMVKTYGPERAVEITLRILRGMKRVDLAEKLETDHRGGTASTSHLPLFPPGPDPSSPLCGYLPGPPPPSSFLSHLGSCSGSSGQLRSQRRGPLAEANRDEQFPKLPRTFYVKLTRSGKKRRLETEISRLEEKLRFTKRMLAVPALLEEMNPHDLKTFQSFLTSGLLPDCPPIPESQLENADRQVTVDQMVKTYGPERAVEITLRILRGMKRVLPQPLPYSHQAPIRYPPRTPHFFSPSGSSEEVLSLTSAGSSGQLISQEEAASEMERKPAGEESGELPSTSSGMPRTIFSQCGYPPGPPPPSFLPHLGSFSGSSGQLRSQRPQILSGSALLLTTPEELTEEQLTNDELLSVLSIPESQLENADIQVTVDQMERYDSLRAMETTETNKKSEEDCVPLTDGAPPIIKHKVPIVPALLTAAMETPKLEMDCPPILDIPLEMANSVNTEVAVNTQENTQRMDEELGRERGSPLFLEHHHMSSPDEFTPEIHDQDNRREYQFQCPSAGLFQCSITGLVFRMEGEGEVLYRTVPWDRRLLAQSGKRPAGPLFKFTCLKGSVCQLHLPHCEIYNSGLPCDFLSVAHVTDENMEFIRPHKITETHVIIKISGFSAYGDVKDEDSPTVPIRALVLLFYKPPVVPKKRSILNVLLLPRNVVIREVQEEWIRRNEDRNIYIETNSHCQLTPNQEYNLSTDLTDEYLIKPKDAEFVDFESYENYIPTFQLFIQTVVEQVNLLLKENGGVVSVWDRLVWLPVSAVSPTAPPANHSTLPGRGFIRNHRMALETRLGLLQPLFLRLQDRGVLIDEEREEVVSKSTKTQQNQALLDMVVRKGDEAQEEFYQVLREADHFLVKDLEKKKA
ncbi:hypothetical protein J4Q44_G00291090 [Coregonus suidteri]|uniref:Uncharacterized protein n=1 Tax=Coregonus suidteri TaxID=861788 RepID=A0AAN8QJB9_9TELE